MFVRKPKSQYDFATKKDVWMLRRGKPLQSPKKDHKFIMSSWNGRSHIASVALALVDRQPAFDILPMAEPWQVTFLRGILEKYLVYLHGWDMSLKALHATSGCKRGSTEAGETLDRFQLYLNPPFTAVGLSLALEVAWMHSQAGQCVILATNRQVSGPGRTFRAGRIWLNVSCPCDHSF